MTWRHFDAKNVRVLFIRPWFYELYSSTAFIMLVDINYKTQLLKAPKTPEGSVQIWQQTLYLILV